MGTKAREMLFLARRERERERQVNGRPPGKEAEFQSRFCFHLGEFVRHQRFAGGEQF